MIIEVLKKFKHYDKTKSLDIELMPGMRMDLKPDHLAKALCSKGWVKEVSDD